MTSSRLLKRNGKIIFIIFVMMVIFCVLLLSACSKDDNTEGDTQKNVIDNIVSIVGDDKDLKTENKTGKEENDPTHPVSSHPDDYYIKWAVPKQSIKVADSWIDRINEKLENEGYEFGLKLILLDDLPGIKSYIGELFNCGADIVFTGYEGELDSDGNIINNSEVGLVQGKFECLDKYLEESVLYTSRPKLFWDRTLYNGSIYLFPSEVLQPGAEMVMYNDAFSLNGDICELINCVNEGKTLFYGLTGFEFMDCCGFYYDELKGIVVDKDGNIINPFDEECCIRWLKTLRSLYENNLLVTNSSNFAQRDSCDIRFPDTSDNKTGSYGFVWKMPLCRTYKCSTAILTSSNKKEQAFKLIEILRTRPDYGNLLIYGDENPEKTGYTSSGRNNEWVFGMDDGLMQMDDGNLHFSSFDERNDYYNNHVTVSPTLYMDFPPEYIELYRIVDRYLGIKDSIIEHDNFEEELEIFKIEYSEALKTVLDKMNK